MTEAVFPIESGTSFVDQVIVNCPHIRTGYGVIADIVLGKTQSGEGRNHRGSGAKISLRVIDHINAIFVRKIVVHAKGSQIPRRTAGD